VTKSSVAFLLSCLFVTFFIAAMLFWVPNVLAFIAFAAPQNDAWRNWLNILLFALAPPLFGATFLVSGFRAIGRGRLVLGPSLAAVPVAIIASFAAAMWVFIGR